MDVQISAADAAGLDLDLFKRSTRISDRVVQELREPGGTIPGHRCHAEWGAEPRQRRRPQASRIYGKETLVSAMATHDHTTASTWPLLG